MPFRERRAILAIALALFPGEACAQVARAPAQPTAPIAPVVAQEPPPVALVPLWIARPRYPQIAQSARVQGIVIIDIEVGLDGRVAASKVTRSVPLLDHAALDALKETYFLCERCGSTPVHRTMQYEFTLPDDDSGAPLFEIQPERIRIGVTAPVPLLMPSRAVRSSTRSALEASN
jgi:TonB family protein